MLLSFSLSLLSIDYFDLYFSHSMERCSLFSYPPLALSMTNRIQYSNPNVIFSTCSYHSIVYVCGSNHILNAPEHIDIYKFYIYTNILIICTPILRFRSNADELSLSLLRNDWVFVEIVSSNPFDILRINTTTNVNFYFFRETHTVFVWSNFHSVYNRILFWKRWCE